MTRLIVEDGGRRRAFRLGDGKLTVGSSEKAKLRLASDGVADIHVELEVTEGVITLVCKPGVLPPKLAGRPLAGRVKLKHGVPVAIGGATIQAEYPEAEAAPQPVVQPVQRSAAGARGSPQETPSLRRRNWLVWGWFPSAAARAGAKAAWFRWLKAEFHRLPSWRRII